MQPITQDRFKLLPLPALSSLLLAAFTSTTPVLASPPASLYSVTGINAGLNVTGAVSTVTTGINSVGDVVGSIELGQGVRLAYVWRDGKLSGNPNGKVDQGEIELLPSTLGGKGSGAEAINDLGQIVGYAMKQGRSQAARWNGNQWIDLGTLGGDSSHAFDINNKGQIVGTAQNSSGSDRGFIFSPPAQTLSPAICPNNYVLNAVVAINDNGDWIGSCGNSGNIYLALLPIFGSSLTQTLYVDINNNKLIAGNAGLTNGLAGFVYDPTNPASSLTLLQPNVGGKLLKSTEVKALNDSGAIVGSAGSVSKVSVGLITSNVYSPDYATLWTDPNAPITNLNNQINSACNWNLKEATDISNNGQIIGNGTHNGIAQGFRLNPFTGFDLKLGGGVLEIDEGQAASLNLESWAPGDCTPLTNNPITYITTAPDGTITSVTGDTTYTTTLSDLTDKQTNTVTVTAEAQANGQTFSSLFSTIVKVRNLPPTIDQITFNNQVVAASNPNVTIQVGDLFDLGIVARDPGIKDILSSNWSSPDGSSFLSKNPSGSWQFDTPGIYHLLATAMDGDGGKSDPRSIIVTVNSTAAAVPEPTTIGGLLVAGAIGAQLRRQAARRKKT